MARLLLRLAILTAGLGLTELGLTGALGRGAPADWALLVLVGFPVLVLGTLGFLAPILRPLTNERTRP